MEFELLSYLYDTDDSLKLQTSRMLDTIMDLARTGGLQNIKNLLEAFDSTKVQLNVAACFLRVTYRFSYNLPDEWAKLRDDIVLRAKELNPDNYEKIFVGMIDIKAMVPNNNLDDLFQIHQSLRIQRS